MPPGELVTAELAGHISAISRETGRQVGVLIDRAGEIRHVMIGDGEGILIPDLSVYPLGRGKLRQMRLVHTHLRGEPLTEDDIADLTLLRLDALAAVCPDEKGRPSLMHFAHLLPPGSGELPYKVFPPQDFYDFLLDFASFIAALGDEMAAKQERTKAQKGRDNGILIHVSGLPKGEIEDRIKELKELCRTDGINVLDVVIQKPRQLNPRYLLGEGKIREVIASALQKGVDLLVFDHELTPAQARAISEITDIRVVDRTQVILDIFAKRAHTPDGKTQVELAQLRYVLPRLAGKGTAMSRLMGGVGGRGPGESKLELDRRRVRDKISQLEKKLEDFARGRVQRRKKRTKAGVPIVSIVGYTNAGKSTLLNALTSSDVFTEDLLFATLDTSTRRLRFPKEREVIITDTVGFIRDLPKGLVGAFKATLEELSDANLLLHVVDVSNPAYEKHMVSVESLLDELGLSDKPVIAVFNKADLLAHGLAAELARKEGAVVLSAKNRSTFASLMEEMERRFWVEDEEPDAAPSEGSGERYEDTEDR